MVVVIEDFSTNGTYLNGVIVSEKSKQVLTSEDYFDESYD